MVTKNNNVSKNRTTFPMFILSNQMFYSRKLCIIHVYLCSSVKKNLINPRADDFFHNFM